MSDSVTPSRQGFLREVLFAAPTPRTPEYDDYTPDSYHADKLDLAIGLPDEAVDCGTDLRGLLVVGPLGPLWAYHVVAFLADDDSVRMNTLVMPHARITGKATARLAPSAVESLYDALTNAPLMQPGQPIFPDSLDSLARDFSYTLLLARYTTGKPEYWSADLEQAQGDSGIAAVEHLQEAINGVLALTRPTYPDTSAMGKR